MGKQVQDYKEPDKLRFDKAEFIENAFQFFADSNDLDENLMRGNFKNASLTFDIQNNEKSIRIVGVLKLDEVSQSFEALKTF